jgi:hypothetical protein
MDNSKNILPSDFDGVFRFTNWTDRDFTAKWDNVEYTFPALKSTPMVMPFTPLEIQNIRKKFARELGVREFYHTDKFKGMDNVPPGGIPALYTDSDIAPFTQKCLEPLPLARAEVKVMPKDDENKYRKNTKGRPITRVLEDGESLTDKASGPIEE